MMAFFTGLWTGIAFGALTCHTGQRMLILFVFCMIYFIVQGIIFIRIARRYPSVQSAEDEAEGKKKGMWFGIIFGAEGFFIFLAVNLVNYLGHPVLTIPAIALVVGLHFYPMAWLFERKIDYWLATWATGVAVCGIVFTLNKNFREATIVSFVGIGMAIATSCYGLYMIWYGKKMITANPIS
jgi:hypothetical protein